MLKSAKKISRFCPVAKNFFICVLLLVAFAGSSKADKSSTDGTTPPVITPGAPAGSYSLGGLDNINLFNGSLSFALPLMRVGGRGEAGYTMMLPIESHWRVLDRSNQFQEIFVPTDFTWYADKPGYGPGLLLGRAVATNLSGDGSPCVPYSSGNSYKSLTRLTFILPDGTEYEFRDQNTGGQTMTSQCSGAGYNRGTVFVTADGTAATFIADSNTPIIDQQGTLRTYPTGNLFLRDGLRYRVVNGQVMSMRDRNGNTLSFAYGQYGVTSITDSLNRQITINYANLPSVPYDQITFSGFNGAPRTIRINYSPLHNVLRTGRTGDINAVQTLGALFPELTNPNPPSTVDPYKVSSVVLPDSTQQFQFSYNVYGELARVVLPTGGMFEYDFKGVPKDGNSDGVYGIPDPEIYRRVSEKRAYQTANTQESKEVFSLTGGTVDRFDATGTMLLRREKHYFNGDPTSSGDVGVPPFNYPAWNHGKEYKTEQYNTDGVNPTTMLRRVEQIWQPGTPLSANPTVAINGRVVETVMTLGDTNQVSKQSSLNPNDANDKGFDQYNNQTDVWEYDFGTGSPGALLRHTKTDYLTTNSVNGLAYDTLYPNTTNPDPAATIHLRSLSTGSRVYAVNPANGAQTLAAQSTIAYDEPAYPVLTYGSLTGWIDPGTAARGNVSTAGKWLDTTGAYLQTHAQYDQAGSLRNAWDAIGNQSQIEYSSTGAYAYPTLTRTAVPDPSGAFASTASLVATSVYDLSTGLVTSTSDANGQTTSFEYNDVLDRLTRVNRPDGGRTTYIYVDAHQCGPYIETRTLLDSSGREADSYQFFDGLHRPKRAFTLENQDTNNPYLTVDTQYDALGRAWSVSNPYRSTGCTSTINPSGRWARTTFDALGRPTKVTTADNAAVTTSYSGNTVTVTDQHDSSSTLGHSRKSVTDALGRMTDVYEDANPNGANYLTHYTYDVLGNLRRVDQGSQQRFFMYDSLGRLIRARNAEQGNFAPDDAGGFPALTDSSSGISNGQWSMGYIYDANGNLIKRRDPRGVVTSYEYDGLNRNKKVRYTDGTKDIDRHYDNSTSGKNGKGRFWYFNWDENNNTRFDTHVAIDQYDAIGRPLNYRQHFLTNGVASPQFNVTRTYDKAGHVITQTNPSGHTVTYNYDAAGRLGDKDASNLAFSGNLGDGVTRIYSTGITYSELGGLQQEQFGTQTALYHKLHYNVRGQLYDIRLSTVAWAADQWNWNRGALLNWYDSTSGFPRQNPNSAPDNNGNVTRQEIWIPTDDQISGYNWMQQNYSYDSLNRLASVTELQSGSSTSYTQSYDYDRWGNRTVNPSSSISNVQFDKADAQYTNRLYAPGDTAIPTMSQRRIQYDLAGNQINDSYSGQGQRTYDAENRMKQGQGSPNNQWQTYTYDADGRRIKRNVNGVETWQLYGIDGELLAEYQAGAAPFLPTTEYGYRGGELLVTIANGDVQRLNRFVTNLYYGAKQRDPSAAELQDSVNQLAAAGAQSQSQLLTVASQIARSLFTSTNYETSAPARTDIQYVGDLYYAYLQRGPDDGGLNWWAGQAAGSRVNVCNGFEASGEFQTLVSNLYGTAASDNERTEHFVNDFYLGAYSTSATATQLQQQRDALNAAAAQSQAAVQTQAETFGRSLFTIQVNDSSISNTQYVTNLYEAFLQRGPDAGGLGWWAGQASVGTGRQNVLNAFATCGAFRDLSGTLYREANWLVADHLGTPRMIVNKSGLLFSVKRHDYLPFGEELSAGTGGRTTAQGYSADSVRQKFTSKEQDNETGLDYFLARFYSSTQGRFASVDPEQAGARSADPQSWNGYAYARNNPLLFVDPDGLDIQVVWDGGGRKTFGDAEFERIKKDLQQQGFIVKNGNIYAPVVDDDGNVVGQTRIGTYSSDCLYCEGLVNEMAARGPAIKKLTVAFAVTAVVIGTAGGTGAYLLTPSLAPTVITLGLRAAPVVLPAVPSAIDKLSKLGISIDQANAILQSPASQKLIDLDNEGNINVIQEVGGKLIRITTDPAGQRIISAGMVRANQITNGIASGRFVKK